MLSFKQRSSSIAIKKSKKPLQEGIQLSPSDFINEFTVPRVKTAESQRTVVVTVRDFLHAIENAYEDDWTVKVTYDFPEPGSFLVRFEPPEDREQ